MNLTGFLGEDSIINVTLSWVLLFYEWVVIYRDYRSGVEHDNLNSFTSPV